MKFGDIEFEHNAPLEPQDFRPVRIRCSGKIIHQLAFPDTGYALEYEKHTWVDFEDLAEALGLVIEKKEAREDSELDEYSVCLNPCFFEKQNPPADKYYCRSIKGIPIETWDITQAWDLGRNEAQALQYILRAQYKGQEKEDLEKAIKFIQRALEEMEDTNS